MSRNRISTPLKKHLPKIKSIRKQKIDEPKIPLSTWKKRRNQFLGFTGRLSKKVAVSFIIVGLAFIIIPRLSQIFPSKEELEINPIKADSTLNQSASQSAIPVRIIIPSVAIDIAVQPSRLINGFWEVFEKTAGYGQGSSAPGLVGNTVIFAHARDGLFLPLKNITFGKDIYVLTNNSWHQYRVYEVREVNPRDVYIIQKTTDERLTVFTCSGFLDQKRLVVIAKPVK